MRVFVAGEQISEGDDFSWTVPGELVHFPTVICADPACGCGRAMCGFASHRATSIFEVRDLEMTPDTFSQLLWDSLETGGWVTPGSADDRAWVEAWAGEHLKAAADFLPELPLRFRNWVISVRDPFQAC